MFLLYWGSEEREYKEKSLNDDANLIILVLFLLCLVGMIFLSFSIHICCWNLEKKRRKQKFAALLLTNPTTTVSSDGFIVPCVLYNTTERKEINKMDKMDPNLNVPTGPLCSPYDSTEVIIQVWETNHQMQDMYLARTFFNIIKIWYLRGGYNIIIPSSQLSIRNYFNKK